MPKLTIETEFKPVTIEWEGKKITAVRLGETTAQKCLNDFPFPQIIDYFKGKVVEFHHYELDFLTAYSKFSRIVLEICQEIPYGQLISYAELARRAGHHKAYRAVGSALAKNRCPLIIPCHRVIGSKGELGGFSAGLGWKQFLIDWEKQHH